MLVKLLLNIWVALSIAVKSRFPVKYSVNIKIPYNTKIVSWIYPCFLATGSFLVAR